MKFLRWYTPKFRQELEKLIPELQKSLAGEVSAKAVRRFKAVLNKANFRKAFPKDLNKSWNEIESFVDSYYRIYLNPIAHQAEAQKWLKRADANQKDLLKTVIEICEEFKEPYALQKQLEAKLTASKEVYTPERASNEVIKQLHDLLISVTASTHKQLLKQWDEVVMNLVSIFENRKDQGQSLYHFFDDQPWSKDIVGRLVEHKGGRTNEPYVRVKDFQKRKKEIVEREVKRIEAAFLQKNLAKVSPIVEQRKDFESVKLLRTSVSAGNLEGSLAVVFKAVSFVVKSQVVWSTSQLGNSFVRYPTTFHQVKTKAGVIAKASEEYMNEQLPKG